MSLDLAERTISAKYEIPRVRTMDMTELRVLLVGHLPVHVDPLAKGLRQLCEVETLLWKPLRILGKGSSLFIVPLLIVRILIRSALKKTDLIFAQYAYPDGFSSTIAAKLLNLPSAIQVIGSDILIAAKGLKRRLIGWTVSNSSGVICVSRELEAAVREMGASNTTVIPSPLDLSDFPHNIDVERVQRRMITVATLTKIKGLDILLKALEGANDFELLIVGDGFERGNLENLARSLGIQYKVKFLGKVPHEEVWRHLLSSSLFILPSRSEGLPRALLEAMACGLFIIATKVGGVPDAVKDGWNGILVEPENPDALRGAISRALSDQSLVKTTFERNRSESHKYHLETIAERQLQFLKPMVQETRQ